MQTPSPNPGSKLLKRLVVFVALGAGLAVSLPFLGLAGLLAQDSWTEWQRCRGYTQFDTQAWQTPTLTSDPRYVRSCMVDDLLAQERLLNQPQAAVKVLLGEPESDVGHFQEYDWVYFLGPERSFISIDAEWLVLKFDAKGRVSEARLMTD